MKKKSTKISVIIPTYNEAENIKKIIPKVASVLKKDYEIVVVDDDSPDKTWQIAEDLGKKYKVNVIRRFGARGNATATLLGFQKAKGDLVGKIDVDGSHPPETLLKIRKAFEDPNVDIVLGTRYAEGGGIKGWSVTRHLYSTCATILAKPITSVSDPLSGFFYIRKKILNSGKLRPKGFKLLLEILGRCRYKGVVEIPYVFISRKKGKSNLKPKVAFQFFVQVAELYWHRLTNK